MPRYSLRGAGNDAKTGLLVYMPSHDILTNKSRQTRPFHFVKMPNYLCAIQNAKESSVWWHTGHIGFTPDKGPSDLLLLRDITTSFSTALMKGMCPMTLFDITQRYIWPNLILMLCTTQLFIVVTYREGSERSSIPVLYGEIK